VLDRVVDLLLEVAQAGLGLAFRRVDLGGERLEPRDRRLGRVRGAYELPDARHPPLPLRQLLAPPGEEPTGLVRVALEAEVVEEDDVEDESHVAAAGEVVLQGPGSLDRHRGARHSTEPVRRPPVRVEVGDRQGVATDERRAAEPVALEVDLPGDQGLALGPIDERDLRRAVGEQDQIPHGHRDGAL